MRIAQLEISNAAKYARKEESEIEEDIVLQSVADQSQEKAESKAESESIVQNAHIEVEIVELEQKAGAIVERCANLEESSFEPINEHKQENSN